MHTTSPLMQSYMQPAILRAARSPRPLGSSSSACSTTRVLALAQPSSAGAPRPGRQFQRSASRLEAVAPSQSEQATASLDLEDQVASPRVDPKDLPTPPPASVPRSGNVVPAPGLRRGEAAAPPREVDREALRWARRKQELEARKMYIKEQWYCAALSQEVKPGKPHAVDMLSMNVMLMRDAKTKEVRCISDICPHRGAKLSKGWVADHNGHTCVVCPYHAWAIDGEGKLHDVPAAEQKRDWTALGKVVPTYDVVEKGGFIWLYFGTKPADARPPIPYVPELDDPTWEGAYGDMEFNAPHWGVFENATDFAHIHTVHSSSFGNSDKPEIKNLKAVTDAHSVTATFDLHNKPVNKFWEFSQVPVVHVTAKALLPSTSYISFTLGNGLSFITFVNTVPVDEHRTINRFCLIRKLDVPVVGPLFNAKAWNRFAVASMRQILTEDKGMVEYLRTDMLPREISVKADLAQTAFRKLRQSCIDQGNGVMPEQIREMYNLDQ